MSAHNNFLSKLNLLKLYLIEILGTALFVAWLLRQFFHELHNLLQ